jgi:hypothetical protein
MDAHPQLIADRPHTPAAGAPARPRPDYLAIAATIAVALFVLSVAWIKLASVDLGYHVAYGRHFLETGAIVDRDPFLYPENARDFVNANWGSQVVMAVADRVAGAAGLVALRLGLIATVFFCIAAIVRRVTDAWHWVAAAWLLAAAAAYERFSLRPELFSYAAMMLMLVVVSRGVTSRPRVAALVALQLAWVNLHSYFLVGLLLTGCWMIDAVIASRRRRGKSAPTTQSSNAVRLLACALALQAAVCFINPWFARGAVFPLETLGYLQSQEVMGATNQGWSGQSPWSAISEFKSPFSFIDEPINARTIRAYVILLVVGGFGAIGLLALGRAGPALFAFALIAMSLMMRRNIAQFALAAPPLTVIAFSAAEPWSSASRRIGRLIRVGMVLAILGTASWWTFAVVSGRFYFDERRITREFGAGYSDRAFARGAAEWIASQPDLSPRLYVNYFASSNALLWLPKRFQLFVDTNTFAYEESVLATDYRLGLGEIDHNALFDEYGVNVVLVHCGSNSQMLVKRLIGDYTNWALVYVDRTAVVFVRRILEHVPVILAHSRTESDLDAASWIDQIHQSQRGPWRRATGLCVAAGVPLSLDWHEAVITLCEAAVALAPDYYEAWYYLGVANGNLGHAARRGGDWDAAGVRYA